MNRDSAFTKHWRGLALRPLLRKRVLVAAACFRIRRGELEFLLVRTRGGRWTFPKGAVNGDRSDAEAATREAREEAGVIGRTQQRPFARYRHVKSGAWRIEAESLVKVYLCEVVQVQQPEETFRMPRWFSPEAAKSHLAESRTPSYAREAARVVDLAVERLTSQRQRFLACP